MTDNDIDYGSLKKIIQPNTFELPNYQRSYAWNQSQIKDFKNDIDYLIENDDIEEHYLDSIVIYREQRNKPYQVVDGQQRITTVVLLFAAMRDVVTEVKDEIDDDTTREKMNTAISSCQNMIEDNDGVKGYTYFPDDKQSDVYQSIVDEDETIPSKDECERPSNKNMIINMDYLRNWLGGKVNDRKERIINNDEHIENLGDYIADMVDDIRRNVSISMYIVENELEANRMFEIINDRGKKVSEADKIKSYLTYYLSLKEDEERTNRVKKVFDKLEKKISGQYSSKADARINKFISEHWRIFSGKPEDVDSVHRELKSILPRDLNKSSGATLIDSYLTSLEDNMVYFKYLYDNPNIILNETKRSEVKENRVRLYVINEFGPGEQTLLPYASSLLSAYKEGDKELKGEVEEALEAVESLVIKYHNLLGRRNDFCRSLTRKYASDIEWSRIDYDSTSVFREDKHEHRQKNDNLAKSVKKSHESLTDKMSEYDFASTIGSIDNLLDGDANSTGVDKNVLKYVFHRIENKKYKGGSYSVGLLSDYHEQRQDKFSLEHIMPKNLDSSIPVDKYAIGSSIQNQNNGEDYTPEDMHKKYKNNLGNLALLAIGENIEASNKPYKCDDYESKIENVYQKPVISKMIRIGVVDEYDEWTTDNIEDRESKLIDLIDEYWDN